MAEADASNTIKSLAEIESDGTGVVRRWLAELDLAGTTEEEWRRKGGEVWKLYRSKDAKSCSFNILWSNTETMRPALYNSTPRPDVRRRFRDPDPVGKVASNVLERSLTFSIDSTSGYDFDNEVKLAILDTLLPGRGVVRVKYVPTYEGADKSKVKDEAARCQHVDWQDYRRGPGKKWDEVPWEAFRHDLTYEECVKMFGKDIAQKLDYTERGTYASEKHQEDVKALLRTVEVWEIWDKDTTKVHFISQCYSHGPLKSAEDPLKLTGFFCTPRPLYAIEDTESLIPQIHYEKYREQAEELNEITMRLRRIIRALKVRGGYASHLSELAKIIHADDNEMVGIENASGVKDIGGLEKAIWMMPIDKLAQVAEALFVAREKCIQTIYEITGLGDIMRGVTNPHETLGAQQLKSQWGSLRLQRLQREVQRFIRDLLRLKAEIMAEHFSVETFQAMTGIVLPTAEQKQQIQEQLAAAQMQAQSTQAPASQGAPPGAAPGAPPAQPPAGPPPELMEQAQSILKMPTWDEVMQVLQSDHMRQYRIGIETDSTVAETIQKDVEGLTQTITGIVSLFQGIGPAVQMGILSVDVVKQLALSAARLAHMGQPVEDAIEQIKQPPPMPATPPDNSVEVAKIEADVAQKTAAQAEDTKKQVAQLQEQTKQATASAAEQTKLMVAQMQEQSKQAIAAQQEETKKIIAQMQAQIDAMVKQQVAANQEETKRTVNQEQIASNERTRAAELEVQANVDLETAERNAQASENNARVSADASTMNAETSAQASRDNAQVAADAKSKSDAAKLKPSKKVS